MRSCWSLLALLLVSPVQAAPSAKPIVVENALARDQLNAVVQKGPQRFIATISVDPVMEKGRFVGFRIVGVAADSPMAGSANIRPGDVVMSVNRESLERPEQFMRAWEVVRNAPTLEVMVRRGMQRYLYRWKIVP